MPALRSRTMPPLIASSLLFVSFFFTTVHLGEGLSCYECSNMNKGKCEGVLADDSLTTCTNPITETSPTATATATASATASATATATVSPTEMTSKPTSGQIMAETMTVSSSSTDNPDEKGHRCFLAVINIRMNDSEQSLIRRGCTNLNNITLPIEGIAIDGIRSAEYRICDSDKCNSSGGIQIGLISLFLPLIAFLIVTR